MSIRRQITIIGAGLAGSLMAILLRRRGFEVDLFERRPDSRRSGTYGGRSINLALSERGLKALALAGLEQTALKRAIPMRGRLMHAPDGKASFQAYSPNPDEYINAVSRAGLNEILIEAAESAGAIVRFNQNCLDVDFDSGIIQFVDVEKRSSWTHHADTIIAADGASSNVRQSMEAEGLTETSIDQLDHAYKELTIPSNPDGSHQIERQALHIWPRQSHMLIALPNLDGSFTCTLFLARDGTPGFSSLNNEADVQSFFSSSFPDATRLMANLASDFETNPTSSLQTVRSSRWHVRGRVLLIGDAAHAIVPFYGQGMNCAFEDCRLLDRIIDENGTDWESTFVEFSTSRKADTDAIAELALGNFIEMRDRVADKRFLLQKALEVELAQRFPGEYIPIYSHVTFSHIPYSEALVLARQQQQLLDELLEDAHSLEGVDWSTAEDLLQSVSSRAVSNHIEHES